MIYFISDTHFNHNNIIKYEQESRPFKSIEEMNEKIIENWNSLINNKDTVYVLGDFFMGNLSSIKPILQKLKGNIILVRGNHDTAPRLKLYKECGIAVKDIEYLTYKGKFFIMCHFPIYNQEFFHMTSDQYKEIIFLYGHIHSQAPKNFINNTYHVGADTNNLTPISIDDILEKYDKENESISF